jgi:uncharacterized protein (DUF58 family)
MIKKPAVTPEIKAKIRHIALRTNRLLNGRLVGDSRTAQKGVGFEFNAIREYQQGDDIRFIDWYASCRMNNLLVKEYIEERNRTILLAVDISHSALYGSGDCSKRDLSAQIASVLALVAAHGNDSVGVLLFSDTVEKYIRPGRGKFHAQAIMEALFAHQPLSKKTDIAALFKKVLQIKKKNALLFLISDCIDDSFLQHLRPVVKMYDVIITRFLDKYEQELPSVGFLTLEDIETGTVVSVDARTKLVSFLRDRVQQQNKMIKKSGASLLQIESDKDFIADLIRFFARRMRY